MASRLVKYAIVLVTCAGHVGFMHLHRTRRARFRAGGEGFRACGEGHRACGEGHRACRDKLGTGGEELRTGRRARGEREVAARARVAEEIGARRQGQRDRQGAEGRLGRARQRGRIRGEDTFPLRRDQAPAPNRAPGRGRAGRDIRAHEGGGRRAFRGPRG